MRAFRVFFLLGVASMATGATAPMLAAEDALPGSGSKQALANASVTIQDFRFEPPSVSVTAGDQVTWTNRDTAQHDATEEGEFTTGLLKKGESASVTFDTEGTFAYICTVHPDMKGKVVVRAAGGSGGGSEGGGGGGSGATSGGGSGGTTATDGGSSAGSGTAVADSGTAVTAGSGSSSTDDGSAGGQRGSGNLPYSGDESLYLMILGAGLLALGLLSRALHEHAIWR
jgi:plastocyanin